MAETTLEFRFEGENLTVILNHTHRISTRHAQLTECICIMVLTKGMIVKKMKVQAFPPAR